MSSAKEVYDHMGNYFSSLSGMCKYWGISPDLYLKRLSRGWSQKDVLTKARRGVKQKTSVIRDKYGRVFTSLVDMCRFYNVNVDTYKERRQAGFSQEMCLLKCQVYTTTIQDHTGREYASLKDMCIAWGISEDVFLNRLNRGDTMKETLEVVFGRFKLPLVDLKNRRYASCIDLCKENRVDIFKLRKLLVDGYSRGQALILLTGKE